MHDTDLMLRFFQHLSLLNMHFRKALVCPGLQQGLLIRLQIAAPFFYRVCKRYAAFTRSMGKFIRRCFSCNQLTSNGSIAEPAGLFRPEYDYFNAAPQGFVFQHMDCFQRAHHAAHAVVSPAMDDRIQMGAACHRRQGRVKARLAQKQVAQHIFPYFQVQVFNLLQQPHLGRLVRTAVSQPGNAVFGPAKFCQPRDQVRHSLRIYR